MNQISQGQDYGRAFRCFAVYNTLKGEMTFVLKRGCNKSFKESYQNVMKHADNFLFESIKTGFYIQCASRAEWHGILNEQTKCYFLMMCFPASNQDFTKKTLNQLKVLIEKYSGYENLSRQDLESKMKAQVVAIIYQMEEQYIEKLGPEGEASDDEESVGAGIYKRAEVEGVKPKIEASSNLQKSNQNLQQKSQINPQSQNDSKALQQSQQVQQQQLQKSEQLKSQTQKSQIQPNQSYIGSQQLQQQQQQQQPQQQQQQQQASQIDNSSQFMKQFNPPNSGIIQSSGNLQQKKNTVYRCFAIYSLKERDLIFILRRGCKKSYQGTVEKLKKELGSSGNTLKFYMQGTNQTEWHGILDEKQKCYFLMMTFSGSQQALVMKTLNEIKGLHSTQQIENLGQSVIYQKMMEETMRTVDKFELEYILANGGEGVGIPSDDEGAFSQSQGLNPPIISGTITNLNPFIGLPELTHNQMLQQLKNFKPATQESDKIVLVSSLVLIVVFMIGLVSIYI